MTHSRQRNELSLPVNQYKSCHPSMDRPLPFPSEASIPVCVPGTILSTRLSLCVLSSRIAKSSSLFSILTVAVVEHRASHTHLRLWTCLHMLGTRSSLNYIPSLRIIFIESPYTICSVQQLAPNFSPLIVSSEGNFR